MLCGMPRRQYKCHVSVLPGLCSGPGASAFNRPLALIVLFSMTEQYTPVHPDLETHELVSLGYCWLTEGLELCFTASLWTFFLFDTALQTISGHATLLSTTPS